MEIQCSSTNDAPIEGTFKQHWEKGNQKLEIKGRKEKNNSGKQTFKVFMSAMNHV